MGPIYQEFALAEEILRQTPFNTAIGTEELKARVAKGITVTKDIFNRVRAKLSQAGLLEKERSEDKSCLLFKRTRRCSLLDIWVTLYEAWPEDNHLEKRVKGFYESTII